MSAADRLRQAIEALPEERRQHWEYRATSVYMNGTSHGQVKSLTGGPSVVTSIDGAHGEFIALMDPTVGAVLADLLDAIARPVRGNYTDAAAVRNITLYADALEQAIERSSGEG